MDMGLTFVALPPHPSLRIDAGDRGCVNDSMAKLLATKAEPLAQARLWREHRLGPLYLNPALSSD